MKINSYYPLLCVENLKEVAHFYKKKLGFQIVFKNDWYIHLQIKEKPHINLALIIHYHQSIPKAFRKPAQGTILNFEIEDVDDFYQVCKESDVHIIMDLRDEPWGQRHFIIVDPYGNMIDIIQLIEPSKEYADQYFVS